MADALSLVKSRYPPLSPNTEKLALLAAQKQTRELSLEILRFLDAASANKVSGGELVGFFQNFVASYASKIGPIELVKAIGKCVVAADVEASTGLELLNAHEGQISKSKDASVLAQVLRAELYLSKAKDLSEARTVIDKLELSFEDPIYALSVNGSVRGSFHLVASELYLALGNDFEFYQHLVKFLTYTPLSEIAPDTLTRSTKQAAVIALIHPEINDFGELLSLPAFQTSGGAPAWTVDFLRSIHFGDFEGFNKAVQLHQSALREESQLMAQIDSSLRRKLTMIALAELAGFVVSATNRRLTFVQISEYCRVPVSEVEELVMTTMGTGKLVTGVIDQVELSVVITSVKPRILDPHRVLILKSRVESWAERAAQLANQLNDQTIELRV